MSDNPAIHAGLTPAISAGISISPWTVLQAAKQRQKRVMVWLRLVLGSSRASMPALALPLSRSRNSLLKWRPTPFHNLNG
jgi:hypothetical protein